MTLRSKAFLAAFTVAFVFFIASVVILIMQHIQESASEGSLRRLMSQTFAVSISDSEKRAGKVVKTIASDWVSGEVNPSHFEALAQRQGVDYVFVVNELGKVVWSYMAASDFVAEERKPVLIKTLYNQLRVIKQLKNGVAYFEQLPLYVLADSLDDGKHKVVAGFYLQSLFNRLQQAYGFEAILASDLGASKVIDEHLRGQVKLPGLISPPVTVWIQDDNLTATSFSQSVMVLTIAGMGFGVFLWWLLRVNFILRILSMIDQAHKINTEQSYQKRIKLDGDDELTELVGHYNSVLSTLEYSYNLMVKSNLVTTELISKVQTSTELGSVGSDAVGQQEEDELKLSLDMVNRLSEAVDHGVMELYFQPVFDLGDNNIIQVEGLCRWFDDERGMVPPLDFIALAEKSGQMCSLAQHVIYLACDAITQFKTQGQQHFAVSVNLSLSQFVQPNLTTIIGDAFKKYDIQPYQLEFEIKEHTIARDIDKSADIIDKLHDMGVGICIDDFGLSKFSLMYLQRLPICKIKLSKSFVDRLESNPKETAFIDGIARFSKGLDVRVIAKGVQTEQQLYELGKIESLDCQGYALARPMAMEQFMSWAQEQFTETANAD